MSWLIVSKLIVNLLIISMLMIRMLIISVLIIRVRMILSFDRLDYLILVDCVFFDRPKSTKAFCRMYTAKLRTMRR